MKLELNFKSLTILFLLTCVTLIGISTALNAKPSNSDSPAARQILSACRKLWNINRITELQIVKSRQMNKRLPFID